MLVSRFPFPLEKGDKLRAWHQLKELSKTHEVHLVCLSDQPTKPEHEAEVRKFCKSLHVFRLNPLLIYWNTARQFFTDKPYQVGYFYQRAIQKKINAVISDVKPDHIYCQLVRTAEYVKNIQHIKKTLDYMDALGKGMFRRSENTRGIKRRIFAEEGKRLSEYENRIFDFFNHHAIISEQDRKLINHQQNYTIEVIENGISASFFSYENRPKEKADLVFTGNMNYPPNVEGAEFIVNELLPILSKQCTGTKVLISGANPHARVQQLASGKVEVTGWVEDIRESYARGRVFVAPLFIGTGLQNKLLEAMAMGIPCVTTTLAKNALGNPPEDILLTADSAADFADKIQLLLNDPKLYQRIAVNAKDYVQQSFSWEHSVKKLEKLFTS